MLSRVFTILPVMALLAACQPAEDPMQPVEALPSPYMTPAVTTTAGGLEQREPDTCGAVNYVSVLGQPAAAIQTLSIDRPFRIVEWRGVEDQVYNPQRVVFRLDGAGNIFNIDCG